VRQEKALRAKHLVDETTLLCRVARIMIVVTVGCQEPAPRRTRRRMRAIVRISDDE